MTFAEKLYQLRRQKGISQEELADRLEVSRQAVSRWEMGSTLPDAKNLIQLSGIFGVSIDYLLKDEVTEDRKELAFRQADTPAPKTDPFRSERNRQIGLTVLVMLQVLPLFLYFVGIFIMANMTSLMFASLMNLLNIAVFEIAFHICGDERGRYYRRKYYRITVWLFSVSPLRLVLLLLLQMDILQDWLLWLAAAAVYLTVCSAVTFLLREKKPAE